MRDLFRMYLYQMRKSKGSRVMLILAFASSFAIGPVIKGFCWLLERSGDDPAEVFILFPWLSTLTGIIGNPFLLMNAMLMFLSAFMFFCGDYSRGFIKNTVGLMPRRAYSFLAEFLAVMVHNALFAVVCVLGNLLGTALFLGIASGGNILTALLTFLTKYLLALALTTLIMLLTVSKGNKGLGIVTGILIGSRALMTVWTLVTLGIAALTKNALFNLTDYMPDSLLYATDIKQPYTILIAAGLLALLLPLAVRTFEKRDL